MRVSENDRPTEQHHGCGSKPVRVLLRHRLLPVDLDELAAAPRAEPGAVEPAAPVADPCGPLPGRVPAQQAEQDPHFCSCGTLAYVGIGAFETRNGRSVSTSAPPTVRKKTPNWPPSSGP